MVFPWFSHGESPHPPGDQPPRPRLDTWPRAAAITAGPAGCRGRAAGAVRGGAETADGQHVEGDFGTIFGEIMGFCRNIIPEYIYGRTIRVREL